MNLLEKVKTIADGAANLALWVGSGGNVVSPEVAQARADICLTCPHNRRGIVGTREIAEATMKFLSFKNALDLKVNGEGELHSCDGCGCVIPLMIWEPPERISKHMTLDEIHRTPSYCWKIKPHE